MGLDKSILKSEVKAFIKAHENDDIPQLVIKGSPFENVKIQSIAQQIKGKQIAKSKFPDLYNNEDIIYPPKLNLEQSSSQITAKYKSEFITKNETLIDLTGGMGIDTLAFSEISTKVSYCEISKKTYRYAEHNFKAIKKDIKTHQCDGIEFLNKTENDFDWIYIDPARRDEHNNKVFKLEECTPNVLELLELFKAKASKLLIKTSPLIDINYCASTLPNIKSIHIVSVKNEVKEVLIEIDFNLTSNNPKIIAINLDTHHPVFSATLDEKSLKQNFDLPQSYLYEPNASLMKSGFYGKICEKYNLIALAKNTHLFTSNEIIDFPGRRFKIQTVISPNKKLIKKYINDKKANISTRNYPLKPEQIKKKYGLNDGGSKFVFFTSNYRNDKILIICSKLIN
jgi:16S rRNA G966 N2-methylase RsmD